MDSTAADVVAIITGFAAVLTAIGGMLLAIRAVRTRERRSAKEDLAAVGAMLADERRLRIRCERRQYEMALIMAQHGLDPPDFSDPPALTAMPDDFDEEDDG